MQIRVFIFAEKINRILINPDEPESRRFKKTHTFLQDCDNEDAPHHNMRHSHCRFFV